MDPDLLLHSFHSASGLYFLQNGFGDISKLVVLLSCDLEQNGFQLLVLLVVFSCSTSPKRKRSGL